MEALESLTGQIASMRPAIGPAQLWIRELYRLISQSKELSHNEFQSAAQDRFTYQYQRMSRHDSGNRSIALSRGAIGEIEFWHTQLSARNGKPILATAAMIELRVDASYTAIGACITNTGYQMSEALPHWIIGRSSTERELFAVLRAIVAWNSIIRQRVVRLVMDLQPTARNLIKGGGGVEELTPDKGHLDVH